MEDRLRRRMVRLAQYDAGRGGVSVRERIRRRFFA
jgi:hypothetical protein